MKKTDVLENKANEVNYTRIDQLRNLLQQKPMKRKDMAILLDRRADAIMQLVEARERDSIELRKEKDRVQAAELYIKVLALQVEQLHCNSTGEELTNFFTLSITKEELADVLKNNTLIWSESEDKKEVLLQIGRVIEDPEETENGEVEETQGNGEPGTDSTIPMG